MAAGITVKRERLSEFRAYLESELAASVEVARSDQALLVDGAVSASGANLALIATLSRAGPYGAGNPEPVIALPSHTVAYAEEVGQAHVRVRLRAGDGTMINAIAFRAMGQPLGQALLASRGQAVHAAGTLSVDRWNGNERVQFRIMDIALPNPG
jgi:single-stranded-DNA-specific exonuclease